MKRLRSNPRPLKKKKIIADSNKKTSSGDKKLEDFWVKPKKVNKEEIAEGFKFTRENLINEGSQNIPLIKNPSKQTLVAGQVCTNIPVNYKNKILFNENFIEEFQKILEPILKIIRTSIFNFDLGKEDFFIAEIYDEFLINNLFNTLVKFVLHTNDDFLFIPKSFMTKSDTIEKDKLKLFEGILDSKNITHLQYMPINSKEVFCSKF
jgi:hypothetical protein